MTADRVSHAGELCKKARMQMAYHNHAYEFAGRPGFRPIDIFFDRLDPKLVALELDVFWLSMPGAEHAAGVPGNRGSRVIDLPQS